MKLSWLLQKVVDREKEKSILIYKIVGLFKKPSLHKTLKKHIMEFYAAERKKELIPFATAWVELENIMLSEIRQMMRDKYHMVSPLTGT